MTAEQILSEVGLISNPGGNTARVYKFNVAGLSSKRSGLAKRNPPERAPVRQMADDAALIRPTDR